MDNDIQEDGRTSLLAAFARSPEKKGDAALVTMSPPSQIERVVGAQKVAVKRDEHDVLHTIKLMASSAGSHWYYRFPVKTGGGTNYIEGATIKLANDVARVYGNCEVDTRVTDLGDSWLIYARFTDYESGFTMTRPFQQRKGQRGMRGDSDRMLDINLQIGASKAIRNVIVNSLQSFADFALEEARNSFVDKVGKNIEGYRKRATERLKELDIDMARAELVIGRSSSKWTAPDIARVIAMIQSINDGMNTADEVFPDDKATPASQPDTPAGGGGGGEQGTEVREEAATDGALSAAEATRDPAAAESSADAITAAYERGKEAKAMGHSAKALPGEYRDPARTREALAWQAGVSGQAMPPFKN